MAREGLKCILIEETMDGDDGSRANLRRKTHATHFWDICARDVIVLPRGKTSSVNALLSAFRTKFSRLERSFPLD